MGWQQGRHDDQGAGPDDPALARDPRLAGFAKDGDWDTCPPSAALAAVLEGASGAEWRCPGASTDEMIGMLRQAQAIESWAAATKLGIIRALIRDDDEPPPGGGYHGDLPDGWTKSITHEVALALSMPAVSADKLMWVAWDLHARLRGTGELLAGGALTYAKAKVIYETFMLLSDENAAKAEAMIIPELPGKTYGQIKRLAEQAAIAVDPESAARRRQDAEQNRCRVELFREDSGAVALAGRDLPTDEALAAHAHVCARARQYRDSGSFADDIRMDQFRVAAYLDLLNGKAAETRIASGQLDIVTRSVDKETGAAESVETADARADYTNDEPVSSSGTGGYGPDDDDPVEDQPGDDGPDEEGPGKGRPGDGGPGKGPSGGSPGSPRGDGSASVSPLRLTDLVIPLATLLGLTERPGEGHALGPLDPDLCRELAVAAIGSPWTRLCVTVTDVDGVAIGHGCARPLRNTTTGTLGQVNQGIGAGLVLPAQVNLTITAADLAELAAAGPPGTANAHWSLTRASDSGPPGGHGTWTLTLPDGRQFTAALEPVPTFECDHRHESHAYQPNDRLRHLVQVRDYTCTFPPCSRHARDSDFEHAVPYDRGGRTCACNAGARSRACHRVKQTQGWNVTQSRPGWHEWRTPTGRGYVQTPKHYPV